MNLDKLTSMVNRICFLGGFALLGLVFVEEISNFFGSSVLGNTYRPQSLLLLGTVLFIVVISLLLRQIWDGVKTSNP